MRNSKDWGAIDMDPWPNGYAAQPHWWKVGHRLGRDTGAPLWQPDDHVLLSMAQWCEATTGETDSIFHAWSRTYAVFSFRDSHTYMLFKLRWKGHVVAEGRL